MYSLIFDTTGRSCQIALCRDEKIISSFAKAMDFGQSEALIPEIKKMLEATKLNFNDIILLAVCVGPGSFTGVRSSIAAARAFGIANPKLTVMGISAFEAYMESVTAEETCDTNAVIIETKRDDFYFQTFDAKHNKLSAPKAETLENIIKQLSSKKVAVIGDGVERFLFKPTGLSLKTIKMLDSLPLESLVKCALQKFKAKDIDFPKPLYLRAADVCVKE